MKKVIIAVLISWAIGMIYINQVDEVMDHIEFSDHPITECATDIFLILLGSVFTYKIINNGRGKEGAGDKN